MASAEPPLMELIRAIAASDQGTIDRMLAASPALATEAVEIGASREVSTNYFLDEISHYVYARDTALHIAAAAHRPNIVERLLDLGADVNARNRRGAQPLHYAADGGPGSGAWNPPDQTTVIKTLIAAGADPNAIDKSGVAPIHRAVRDRGAAAVQALIDGGADPARKNKSGSTPMSLANQTTGKSGSGSPAAKNQQALIIQLLERVCADG